MSESHTYETCHTYEWESHIWGMSHIWVRVTHMRHERPQKRRTETSEETSRMRRDLKRDVRDLKRDVLRPLKKQVEWDLRRPRTKTYLLSRPKETSRRRAVAYTCISESKCDSFMNEWMSHELHVDCRDQKRPREEEPEHTRAFPDYEHKRPRKVKRRVDSRDQKRLRKQEREHTSASLNQNVTHSWMRVNESRTACWLKDAHYTDSLTHLWMYRDSFMNEWLSREVLVDSRDQKRPWKQEQKHAGAFYLDMRLWAENLLG